jgi:hypothetical protein
LKLTLDRRLIVSSWCAQHAPAKAGGTPSTAFLVARDTVMDADLRGCN